MFFLPCISIIICVIIVCITFITYKRYQNNTEDNIEVSEPYYPNDFIRLGDYYINIYDIESIYLSNDNWSIIINTEKSRYNWDFNDEIEYDDYVAYLNKILIIH